MAQTKWVSDPWNYMTSKTVHGALQPVQQPRAPPTPTPLFMSNSQPPNPTSSLLGQVHLTRRSARDVPPGFCSAAETTIFLTASARGAVPARLLSVYYLHTVYIEYKGMVRVRWWGFLGGLVVWGEAGRAVPWEVRATRHPSSVGSGLGPAML